MSQIQGPKRINPLADLEKWLGRDETFSLLSRKKMTPNDMRLAAEAYVRTTCDSGFTVQQLIEYVEKTRADPELILAIRTIAKKHDRKPTA